MIYRSIDPLTVQVCATALHLAPILPTRHLYLSMTIFPSDKVLEEYKEKLQKDKQVTNDNNNDSTPFDIDKNLVYLDVFYDELSVTKFEQVPAMTWSALLADLGGQMGLFLGMSAITAAEVVEYLVGKIFRMCRGGRSSNNKVMELTET